MSRDLSVSRAVGLLRQAAQLLEDSRSAGAASQETGQSSNNAPDRPRLNAAAAFAMPAASSPASVRDNTVITEMRERLFQPYPLASRRVSIGPAPGGRPSVRTQQPRQSEPQFQNFCCLSGPTETTVPSPQRNVRLQALGLGQSVITLDKHDDSSEVELKIRQTFPKLGGHRFEIMRPPQGGRGRTKISLIKVSMVEPIPPANMLVRLRVKTYYVLPETSIMGSDSPESSPEMDEDSRTNVAGDVTPADTDSRSLANDDETDRSDDPRTITIEDGDEDTAASVSSTIPQGRPNYNSNAELVNYRMTFSNEFDGNQELLVLRETFEEDLLSIYKDPGFCYKKNLYVRFMGEPGRLNAVKKEFFTMAMKTLKSLRFIGKYLLLEGDVDHLLPNPSPILLAEGVYDFFGKFLGHSILQTGVGFVGLSAAAIRCIFRGMNSPCPVEFVIEDVASHEKRNVASLIGKVTEEHNLSDDDLQVVTEGLQDAGIYERVTRMNALTLLQQYLQFEVYHSRASCYHQIAAGMQSTGVFEFLQSREKLWDIAFPTEKSLVYSPDDLINVTRFSGEESSVVKAVIVSFIQSLDSSKIRNLLQAWTGSPIFPEDGLEVELKLGVRFSFRACFSQLQLDPEIDLTELLNNLNLSVDYGYVGFGSA